MQRIDGKNVITPPKTKKSIRKVVMPDFLAEEIKIYLDGFYKLKPKDLIFSFSKSFLHHEMDRVSEEEYDLINKQIEISGLSKQEYFIQLLGEHQIKIIADYRVLDAISKEIFQLAKAVKKFGKLNEEEQDILLYILEIYEEIKQEKSL